MHSHKESLRHLPRLILTLGLLISLIHPARAQLGSWTRFGLDGGGVAHDVQLVRHDADEANNELWSVSMSSGYYRATWTESGWSSWSGQQPGKSGLGLDAIEVGDLEYVIVGTSSTGLQFCDDPTSGDPTWDYPVTVYYPGDWKWARIHDAAFFWPYQSTPTSPETQYYFILAAPVYNSSQTLIAVPGLYRWEAAPTNGFVRVEQAGWTTNPHSYSKFYRDIDKPNVLYVTSPNGIYQLSGPYASPHMEKLPDTTRLEDLPIEHPPSDLPPLPTQ